MRLWSGSLKYKEMMVPTAPVLSTGPSSIATPQACREETDMNHLIFPPSQWLHNVTFKIKTFVWGTLRWAATAGRGVLVMRQRSAEPVTGCLAFGSNSWPSWWRLNFCCPKHRALRFPLSVNADEDVCGCSEMTQSSEKPSLQTRNQNLPPSGHSFKLWHFSFSTAIYHYL